MLSDAPVIAPMEEAFSSGSLMMPTDIVASGLQEVAQWGAYPLNQWMTLVSVLLLALNLSAFYIIAPHLLKCLSRWRWNLTVESNMQLARLRDIIGLLMIMPFCLIVSRYELLDLDLLDRYVPAAWMTAAVIGVFAVYLMVRGFMYWALGSRNRHASAFATARKTGFNFFVIITCAMLLTVGIFHATGWSDASARVTMLLEMALFYIVMLLWKGQILMTSCNPLTTFLYLCALEILPTSLLIAANVCL